MKAKWFVTLVAAGLLLSAVPAYAAHPQEHSPEAKDYHHKSHMSGKAFEEHKLARLRYMADYFGIATEGKTAEQLKSELEVAKNKDKAKWEAFKTEHQAKILEHLRKKAAERGIATEGKSIRQLREELYPRPHSDHHHKEDGKQQKTGVQ